MQKKLDLSGPSYLDTAHGVNPGKLPYKTCRRNGSPWDPNIRRNIELHSQTTGKIKKGPQFCFYILQ